MPDARMRLVLIAVVVFAMGAAGAGIYQSRRPAPAPIIISGPTTPVAAVHAPAAAPKTDAPTPPTSTAAPAAPEVATAPTPPPVTLLYVHVAGAVRQPSLYQLPPGSRVMHAIKAAGGPTSKADLDAINLAEKIHDGEKIYVPAKAPPAPRPVAVSAPPVMPAAVPVTRRTASVPMASGVRPPAAASAKPGKLISPAQGQININTADEALLEELPGIGPAMAGRILAFRQQAGGFQKIDDLMNVGGIGPKKYARIAPLVKLH